MLFYHLEEIAGFRFDPSYILSNFPRKGTNFNKIGTFSDNNIKKLFFCINSQNIIPTLSERNI